MKVREILNEDNKTVENLMWLIDGSTYAAEIEVMKQRLVKHGTEPPQAFDADCDS